MILKVKILNLVNWVDMNENNKLFFFFFQNKQLEKEMCVCIIFTTKSLKRLRIHLTRMPQGVYIKKKLYNVTEDSK